MAATESELELPDSLQAYLAAVSRRARQVLDDDTWTMLCDEESALAAEYRNSQDALLRSLGLSWEMFFGWGEEWERQRKAASLSDTFLLSALDELSAAADEVFVAAVEAAATGHCLGALLNRYDDVMRRNLVVAEADWLRLMTAIRGLTPRFWRGVASSIAGSCGFWDRVAQLLNFVYFNIREFDRETFATVIEKLDKNYVREEPLLGAHAAWVRLSKYARDQQKGHVSLAQRRNAIVHSVSFRVDSISGQNVTYTGTPNTLERKRAQRVPQDDPSREVEYILHHARAIAELRVDALSVCRFGTESLRLWPQRFRHGQAK